MPVTTSPPPQLEAYFRDFFAKLYAVHVEFDERRCQLIREKGKWGGDDVQDIYEKQCSIFEQVQDGVSGALQSLSDSLSSVWKEGNTENWVFYHCPGTDFYTLTMNNRRLREASAANGNEGGVNDMIPSLLYFDVVAAEDGAIQLVRIGRESPEWLEHFESFHDCTTSATGPRSRDMERHHSIMEQEPLLVPEDYLDGVDLPVLQSTMGIPYYRSFLIGPGTVLVPDESEELHQPPESWHGPQAFVFWAAEKDVFWGAGEGVLLPTASDAFYFFLMRVIPRICYQCDEKGAVFEFSEYWREAVKHACIRVSGTGNPEEGIALLGERMEKYYEEHEDSAMRFYKPTSVHEYLDRRFGMILTPEILQARYGLRKEDGIWHADDWRILPELIEIDALELPSHAGDSSSIRFGVKLEMYGDEPGFLPDET